jgi:antirestriction protein ArdC
MHIHDLYKSITQSIIAELEKGAAPWIRLWKDGNRTGIMPVNYGTRRPYSGINIVILWAAREESGYPTSEWLTFNQTLGLDARVKKGERGSYSPSASM